MYIKYYNKGFSLEHNYLQCAQLNQSTRTNIPIRFRPYGILNKILMRYQKHVTLKVRKKEEIKKNLNNYNPNFQQSQISITASGAAAA